MALPEPEDFNLAEYSQKVFRMFGSDETIEVELLCETGMMNGIIDQFGTKVKTWDVDDQHFKAAVSVCPSPTFYRWIFGWNGGIKIISPVSIKEEYIQMARKRFQEAVNYYIHVLEYLSQNILQDKLTAEGYTNSVLLNLGDMYRQNGQHQDAYNMYMAAYRNLYALNGSFIKARASEGIAYSSLKLGNLNAASIYIEHYVWEEYLDKHKSDMDLIFYSRCLITRASIIDVLAGREASGPWYDLAFNIITNLFRENSLEDYELLIDLYFFCGDSYSTLIQNGHTYNDSRKWGNLSYLRIMIRIGSSTAQLLTLISLVKVLFSCCCALLLRTLMPM